MKYGSSSAAWPSLVLASVLACAPAGLLGACSTEGGTDAHAAAETGRLQFGIVVEPGAPGAEEAVPYPRRAEQGGELLVAAPLLSVHLAKAFVTVDSMGYPAVGFEIAEADVERFREFTSEFMGSRMAAIVDGTVVTAPVIASPLPGQGVLSGRFSDAEVSAMLAALAP